MRREASTFWEKIQLGIKPIAVELDTPLKPDIMEYAQLAKELDIYGADIITIADSPSANARIDSVYAAAKLMYRSGVETIPHLTCRDRNITAIKALLLGHYAEGGRNILLVTGDPVPKERYGKVKPVFQFESVGLMREIVEWTKENNMSLNIFGALNVNARNFDVEMKRAKDKIAAGAIGLFTQPILTMAAFENLRRARSELNCYLFGGIIPITSARNAIFMDENIQGINVDPQIINMYKGKAYGMDDSPKRELSKEECEDLAVTISVETAKNIAPYIDGYYLMTPFTRVKLMGRIMTEIRSLNI